MAGKTYFSKEENAKLRALALRLKDELGSQEQLAKRLGMRQPSVSAFLTKKAGASPKTANTLCSIAGTTLAALFGTEATELPETHSRRADTYPNREVALRALAACSIFKPALDHLRRIQLSDRADPAPEWWLRRAMIYVDLLRDSAGIDDPLIVRTRAAQ